MTDYMFRVQIRRLIDVFGDKAFTKERLSIFWNIVKDCEDKDFADWVSLKIADSRMAPLGEDFRTFANLARQKPLTINLENKIWCNHCGYEGAIIVERISDQTKWAFVCDCENGKRSHWSEVKRPKNEPEYRIQHWAAQDKSKFLVPWLTKPIGDHNG